jgi:hypothetical protein
MPMPLELSTISDKHYERIKEGARHHCLGYPLDQALLDAYDLGQKEMRERAARLFDEDPEEANMAKQIRELPTALEQ